MTHRILVIGGTGFIGRFLVPQLIDGGHDVAVVQRRGSSATTPTGARVLHADRKQLAASATALRDFAPDVVIDLILSSGRQAEELMNVFRGHASRVVAITSMDVYRAVGVLHGLEEDTTLQPLPLREDSALRTRLQTYPPAQITMLQGIFGWLDDEYDKIPVERAVLGDDALPATVLRLPMIYGPGDRLHRFWGMLRRMDDARPAIVLPESVARWRGPRGYVENVAAAITLAAESAAAARRIYNVGEAESFSELEWARLIADVVGWRGRFIVVPDEDAPAHLRLPGDFRQHWVVDTSRIRDEIGYAEPVPREEAIRRTIAWEREHPPEMAMAQFDYAAEDEAAQSAAQPS